MKEDEVGCKILHKRTKIVKCLFNVNSLNSLANETAEKKKNLYFVQ